MAKAANSFEKYLSRRTKITQTLTKKLDDKKRGFQDEEGFWRPTSDKSGNGWAIIRFLPPGGDEEDPYVHYYEYSFKGPGGNYYEKSRKSLGRDEADPCQEFVQQFWNADDEKTARKYPRKQVFISNILVIKDPEHPENEGKVFKFKYGVQIFNKIEEAMDPKIPGEPSIDAFDLLEGANFKLIIGKKDKYPTYEASKFDAPSKLSDKTEKMAEILDKCYPLSEYVSPDKFKPYDVLKARLEKVLGKAAIEKAYRKTKASDDGSDYEGNETDDVVEYESDDNDNLDEILKDL